MKRIINYLYGFLFFTFFIIWGLTLKSCYIDSKNKYIVLEDIEVYLSLNKQPFLVDSYFKKGEIVFRVNGFDNPNYPEFFYIDDNLQHSGSRQGYANSKYLKKIED